ncbi:MAG: hypothetical protein LBD22_07555, partial [Spirochaetaceae bacterium]|nr:hypothetical protein [Spirochaetaceae bacterium]
MESCILLNSGILPEYPAAVQRPPLPCGLSRVSGARGNYPGPTDGLVGGGVAPRWGAGGDAPPLPTRA